MMTRFFKEPLVHFLLIGGMIFAAYAITDDSPAPPNSSQIIISVTDLAALTAQFESVWKRTPQPDELRAMTQELIRERVMVNAALELGMDQNDAVINRRLQQKMEFFAASIADAVEPQEGELETFYQANAPDYQTLPQFALNQIYLGQNSSPSQITSTLDALKTGADPTQMGRRSLLPARFGMTQSRVLDSSFGKGFSGALEPLLIGEWAGPVQSGYGVHLVQITAKSPASLPPLDQISDKVLVDWQRAKREEVLEQYYQTLRQGYEIILPSSGGDS